MKYSRLHRAQNETSTPDATQLGIVIKDMNFDTLIKVTEKIADLDKNVWHVIIKELIEKEMKIIKQYDEKLE